MGLFAEIISDSPRLYWRLNEPSGSFSCIDYSGNSLAGGIACGLGYPGLHSGNPSSAFFNGSSQYVLYPDTALLDLGDTFTLEAYVKRDPAGSGVRTLIDKGAGAYSLRLNASNQLELARSGIAVIVASTVALDTNPHHVAATKTGSTVKLYVDGVDVTGTVTNATCTNTSNDFQVGRGPTTSNYYYGLISDVAVYPVALSAGRITAHAIQALIAIATANIHASAALAGGARKKLLPEASLQVATAFSADPVRRQFSGANMPAVATLDAAGLRRPNAAAAIAAAALLAALANKKTRGAAGLAGTVTLTAETEGHFIGAVHLPIEGFLRAGRQLVEIPPIPVDETPIIVPAVEASTRLIEALTSSHQLCIVVEVLDGSTGEVIAELDTVDNGTVTLDSSAAIRGRLDLTVIDDGAGDLIPYTSQDTLAPYGNELRVARGVRFLDRTAEAVSLGVFRMRQVNPEDAGSSTPIQITGLDRWSRLTDARFEQTWVIPAGTNVIDAIRWTVQDAYPDCPMDLGTTDFTTAQKIGERGGDRGAFIQELAQSIGTELYFDGTGTLVRQPVSLATDNSRWTIREGDGGALLRAGRALDSERVYNKVIASGETLDETPPVCGSAWDSNPLSPTFYYGPFGQRPRFYVSQMLTTEEQCALAAAGILAKSLGTSQQVTFDQMVDPTMEPGQVVRIMRERLGLDEKHVLDTLTIPLGAADSMAGRTRVTEVVGA